MQVQIFSKSNYERNIILVQNLGKGNTKKESYGPTLFMNIHAEIINKLQAD